MTSLKKRSFIRYLAIIAVAMFGSAAHNAFAQQSLIVENDQLIYEKPTMEKFSQLFVRLGRVDLNDDQVLSDYLHINECKIVKQYIFNEFEWQKIKKATKSFLEKNKENFPNRFEAIQPLFLGEYDFEKKGFEVVDPYKVEGARIFEVIALDGDSTICDAIHGFKNFESGIAIELSRPITLDFVPMSPEAAQKLLAKKNEANAGRLERARSFEDIYKTRDVYMALQVKFFASQGDYRTREGLFRANLLAVLEGLKIYSDISKTDLLYEKTFRSRKATQDATASLAAQIEELRKKRSAMAKERAEKKAAEDAAKESEE